MGSQRDESAALSGTGSQKDELQVLPIASGSQKDESRFPEGRIAVPRGTIRG